MGSKIRKSPGWRSNLGYLEGPEQLELTEKPVAPSARMELQDAAGRQGASGAELREWPPIDSRVLVRYEKFFMLRGVLQEVYDYEYHPGNSPPWIVKRGRIRLDPEQPGISASLSASLPKVLSDVALSQLRKEKKT